MSSLGAVFERLRGQHRLWRNLFFVLLVVLLGLNLVIGPDEAHFGADRYPGFFAGFGLIVGAAVVLIVEKIVRPLIARKEDFYGDL
ncbi:hypothetical protein [Telmatospirillum sp.]|uniref:hypothetical protein n=1 Tax=Telmatospirillum sp. TaxID=2079197 RepID=UPI0028452028|nr:hypothetical protein [Telmatospirillum sp.]MDR3437709.1 hypothetical protein [Telmatospirillum sp.]